VRVSESSDDEVVAVNFCGCDGVLFDELDAAASNWTTPSGAAAEASEDEVFVAEVETVAPCCASFCKLGTWLLAVSVAAESADWASEDAELASVDAELASVDGADAFFKLLEPAAFRFVEAPTGKLPLGFGLAGVLVAGACVGACEDRLPSFVPGEPARDRKKAPLLGDAAETGLSGDEDAGVTSDADGIPTLFIVMRRLVTVICCSMLPAVPLQLAASY
jgi:hypothetical protein